MKTLLKRLLAFRENSKSLASIVVDPKIWLGCLLLLNVLPTVPVQAQSGTRCFTSSSCSGFGFARSVWSTSGDTITIRTSLSRRFVDNTYGTGAIGWPSGHTFSNLTGSDKLTLALYDNNNVKVLEFSQDYISASSAAPSGYKSLGVSGGDGSMIFGSVTNILGASSSLDVNFNQFGYVLTTNSPATDTSYTANPTYPNWIFTVWYEIKVRKSAFGTSGFKEPMMTGIHASPSKCGTNTVPVTPNACPVGSVGDFVWRDNNQNGRQDTGEPGVGGVTVRLYNCLGNALVATTTTDINGYYLFSNLEVDNSYYVVFDKTTLPSNAILTLKDQGTNDAVDSDADPVTGKTVCETITANETNLTFDAGVYLPYASIGDFVWNDLDRDGVQDAGEPGIPNVTVSLYDCTNNTLIATTTTNANGAYLFSDLQPGSYYLVFSQATLPAGFVASPKNQGGNTALDSDADPVTGQTACETLTNGENNTTYDAGFYLCNVNITCPANLNVQCDNQVPTPNISSVTASSSCGSVTVTWEGDQTSVYSRTRTWKAVDCSGNQSPTVSQTINVIDNTPPSIGPAGPNMTVACTTSVNFTPPIATDLCDGNPGVVLVSEVTNNLSCPGGQVGAPYAVTRTWKAVDCSGNESGTVSQTITYDCCQEIYPPICLTSATKPDKVGGSIITTVSGDTITLRVTLAKTFVDNTYGTGAIGWPSGHTFSNLTGSDNLQLALLNKNGTKVLEFKMDYITSTSTSPSGYKSLGVTGGDGGMILGSATNIYSVVTSMDRNFNAFGYILTSNSPSTNAAYTPNPSYPSWIYDVWYEVKVKKSAFGAIGYGRPLVTSIHASPSKTGSNTEPVIECPLFSTSKTNEQCGLPCSGSIDVTTTSGLAPYTYLWSDGNIGEDRNNLCPGTYTVTVTDAAGSVASSTVTILAAPAPPCNVNEVCFASPTKPNIVNAKSTWTISGDTITIRTTLAKTFVDNTYGTNIIGWPSAHKFGDLTGSDNLQLALYNANGAKVTEFKMDYISSSSTVPSGFRCLGVTGGEGKMLLGSASNIYSVTTSIDRNFNQFGYVLTTNSPATNASYAPNATYPSWIYEVWYEVKVNKNAFGTIGFGYPKISGVHASPSKTGSNSEPVDSVPCVPGIPARLSDQNADIESLSLMLYPNPANDVVKLTFNGIESGPVLITLTAMDGKVMDMIYRGNIEAGQVYQVEYGTAHLAAGLYILNFKSEGMTESQRLMIVHQ